MAREGPLRRWLWCHDLKEKEPDRQDSPGSGDHMRQRPSEGVVATASDICFLALSFLSIPENLLEPRSDLTMLFCLDTSVNPGTSEKRKTPKAASSGINAQYCAVHLKVAKKVDLKHS